MLVIQPDQIWFQGRVCMNQVLFSIMVASQRGWLYML